MNNDDDFFIHSNALHSDSQQSAWGRSEVIYARAVSVPVIGFMSTGEKISRALPKPAVQAGIRKQQQ